MTNKNIVGENMKEYVEQFLEQGLVYRSNKYDFLLLKDFIEFVRETDLNVKIKDLQTVLEEAGWRHKKASVLTDQGYQSKDIWYIEERVANTRELPIVTIARANLVEAEQKEAERLLIEIFNHPITAEGINEVFVDKSEFVFTNKGLKTLLVVLDAKGSISKLSSIIRGWSNKILVGEHFFGTSSRTVLFKNYYRYIKPEA